MKTTRVMTRLVGTPLFSGALLVSLLTATPHSGADAQQQPESPDEPLVLNLDEVDWGPPSYRPRFVQGSRTAQLGTDPDSGGPIYYAKFPAGSHFDLHWHTHTEFVVVVSGEVTFVLGEETHSLSPGSYVVIPAMMNHSWDVPAGGEDSVILVRRRGPADFNFVDP